MAGTAHDLRLVPPAFAVWCTALVLIGRPPRDACLVAALAGSAAVAALFRRWHGPTGRRPVAAARPLMGAALACVAASALSTGIRVHAVGSGPVRALALDEVRTSMEATVTGDPRPHRTQGRRLAIVPARAESVRWRGGQVRVRVPVLLIGSGPGWAGLNPGQRIEVSGRFAPPRHTELLAAVVLVRGRPVVTAGPAPPQRFAATIRARLRLAAEVLPPAQRGVLPGMVLGDTSRLDPELSEDFRTAGLSHIMVVSGANLAIIISAVLALARGAGLRRRHGPPFAAVAVVAFVIVARPEPSVLRAAVMGMIGLLALVSGRERQGVPALGAAIIGLVLVDPALARSYGFALSVLATGGLLLLAPAWRDRLCARVPRPAAEALAVTAAAQVGCAPVLVMLSGEISLVSIAANLLAAPMIAPATLLGAAAAVVAPFALGPARLLLWPAGLAVGWIIGVARFLAGVPYATVRWPDGVRGAALLIAVMVVAVPILRRPRLRRVGAACLAGLLLVTVAVHLAAPGWPPRDWRFAACDVGQGDALVLHAAPGQAVVVDAGPDSRAVDGCLRGLGVSSVPLLVLTHPHADHVGGVAGVRRGRSIGSVLTSPLSGAPRPAPLLGLSHLRAGSGLGWNVGSLTLVMLGPAARPGTPLVPVEAPGTEVNNTSVVLVARWPGLRVLLPGDVETEAQRSLAPLVGAVEVLKVPHHGSARQDPAFLRTSAAQVAVVSVGEGNDYGHPAPVTETLLRRYGMRVYRTDLHGDIAIAATPGGIAVTVRGR